MPDETPVVETLKTVDALRAELAKREEIEGRITLAAITKEINALCEKYGVVMGAEAFIERGMIRARSVLMPKPPKGNGHEA